jgi:hypothetical protein
VVHFDANRERASFADAYMFSVRGPVTAITARASGLSCTAVIFLALYFAISALCNALEEYGTVRIGTANVSVKTSLISPQCP